MLYTKDELVEVINDEISNREITMSESGGDYDTTEEVEALKVLLDKVKLEQPLEFTDYTWLSDLVSTDTEVKLG